MSTCTIIGISGVTCSGKTTLAEQLINHFGTNCVLISQDQFYYSDDNPNHEWVELGAGLKHQNWETISSIDWQSFTQTIDKFIEESNSKGSSDAVVLIEGHLIFNYRPISEICHKKFFITLDEIECFRRRDERTCLPKDPPGYFQQYVWPLYHKNFDQMKEFQNHIPIEFLDGNCDQNILFNDVIKSLKQLDH